MDKVEKFKKWHSSRIGHDIGVVLGIDAVREQEKLLSQIEAENEKLTDIAAKKADRACELFALLEEALTALDSMIKTADDYAAAYCEESGDCEYDRPIAIYAASDVANKIRDEINQE